MAEVAKVAWAVTPMTVVMIAIVMSVLLPMSVLRQSKKESRATGTAHLAAS